MSVAITVFLPQLIPSLPLLRRAALEMWKQKLGSNATYNNLIKVFESAGHKDYADLVRRIAGSYRINLFANTAFHAG